MRIPYKIYMAFFRLKAHRDRSAIKRRVISVSYDFKHYSHLYIESFKRLLEKC